MGIDNPIKHMYGDLFFYNLNRWCIRHSELRQVLAKFESINLTPTGSEFKILACAVKINIIVDAVKSKRPPSPIYGIKKWMPNDTRVKLNAARPFK